MSLKETQNNYDLNAALQFYQDAIKQHTKNRHSGYHTCTILKMLGKNVLSNSESIDLRTVEVHTLPERIEARIGHLLPST